MIENQKPKAFAQIYSIDRHQSLSEADFYKKKRHFIILTESGKPVFSRYGNELDLSNVMATWSVIQHKMQNYDSNRDEIQHIQCITTNLNRSYFQKRNGLFFIIITTKKSDTASQLQAALEYVALQINTSITCCYIKTQEDNPNYDPQEKLSPYADTQSWTISASIYSLSNIFNSYMPFPLSFNKRKGITDIMKNHNESGIIYKMLVTQQNVLAIDKDMYDLTVEELNSQFHTINSKFKYTCIDYWVPVCIPSISRDGFQNLYFRWLNEDIGCLLQSGDVEHDNIIKAVHTCQKIERELETKKFMEKIHEYNKVMPLNPKSLEMKDVDSIVIYNPKLKQYSLWGMKVYEKFNEEQKSFINQYAEIKRYILFLF